MEEINTQKLETVEPTPEGFKNKPFRHNMFMFAVGTLGRDFLYNFFNGYLLTFVLLTKTLNTAQFSTITIIIIAARIFDALNDPIMGGIVENTRTKWGKYKPWQLIGCILTTGVIIALFCVDLDNWAFIGFLAFSYFMFSITFTMNDIAYWGMMPTLTSNPRERDLVMTVTQIVIGIGAGACGILVPALTTGSIGTAIFGSAVKAYKVLAIVAALLMLGFQMFTLFGVKEKPLDLTAAKQPSLKLKDMFKTIFKNDQLLWSTLVMLLYNIGPTVLTGGCAAMYIYFEFGYEGLLTLVYGALAAVISALYTFFYPGLSKKYGRDKMLYASGILMCIGYAIMLIICLAVPQTGGITISVLGMSFAFTLKYLFFTLAYTFTGFSAGFYMIMVINMANTVEYNEYKTGKRQEGLIFSLRPFTAKMGSAISQGLISLSYIIAGVLATTNVISNLENAAEKGEITGEEKLEQISNAIGAIDSKNKAILAICMTVIPAIFMIVGMIIYKAKFKLNESTMAMMVSENEKRKNLSVELDDNTTLDNVKNDGNEIKKF